MNKSRIFISSTWMDLKAERRAVEEALHRMQDTDYAGMEYFGSRPETPRKASLAEVDRSAVYVGIFAHRYGSGITEAEYRRAQALGLPILIYFREDSTPAASEGPSDDEPGRLEALKRELKRRHVVSWFTSPDDLAAKLVADLHSLFVRTRAVQPSETATEGGKYHIDISNSQGVNVGDGMDVTQYFSPQGDATQEASDSQ